MASLDCLVSEVYSSLADKSQSMEPRQGTKPCLLSFKSASDFHWSLSLHLVYLFKCSAQTLAASDLTLKKGAGGRMCYFCPTLFCLIEYFLKYVCHLHLARLPEIPGHEKHCLPSGNCECFVPFLFLSKVAVLF